MQEKIFVVEDEFLVVRDLKNQLTSLGYEVVGSTPLAEEAITLTKALKPDLILMDIRLQGAMDGITAAENIRKSCKLPVVYLTANADDATLKRALVTEPFGYILKPFEERELKTVIEMALYKHRAERRLQESEQRFSTTLNSIGDAVIATDEKSIVTFLNPIACALTEWPLSLALGKPLTEVFQIINHFTRQPVNNPVTLVLSHGQIVGLANNTILISRSGREIPIDDCAAPIRDDEGNCTGVVLVFRDVTEKKKAEEQIQKSEARFRQLADAAPVMMWLTNLEQEHIFFSKPWLDFTGRTILEESGQGWRKGVRKEDQEDLFSTYDSAFLERKAFQLEYHHKRHDGIYRWLLLTGVPVFTENHKFDGFIGTCIDITEHKQLEEKMQQIQKMESIGQLASGVAHDFNNLLTVINGYSSLLLKNIPKKHTWHTAAKEILFAGERAAELTRQLLIFSSKQMIQMKPLQLNKVITNMEKMLRRLIPENITLQTLLANNLHIIEADPSQIQQVLMNLVVNARDAMPEGGTITIKTSNCHIDKKFLGMHSDLLVGDYVQLSVIDTGTGISESIKDRIFEPFFTTKEVGKGTGLGLATVYGIVRQCRGTIDIETNLRLGTTFNIFFPLSEREISNNIMLEEPRPINIEQKTILVVEDEDIVRKVICEVTEDEGYKVLEAQNGAEALQIILEKGTEISLIITDIVMPKMSGQKLGEYVSTTYPKIKMLYISGYMEDDVLHKIISDEVFFLQKPFTPDKLIEKIRTIIEG